MILYNLRSAYKRVGLPEEFHTARPKRLRFLLLNTVGKVVRHARETLLRCTKEIARALADASRTIFSLKPRLSRGLRYPECGSRHWSAHRPGRLVRGPRCDFVRKVSGLGENHRRRTGNQEILNQVIADAAATRLVTVSVPRV